MHRRRRTEGASRQLSPDAVARLVLAGEPITAKLTRAPGNDAPIGGLKVVTANGWFAARPSGTENIYKIYAESFRDARHLQTLVAEAQRDRVRIPEVTMNPTQALCRAGQSLWLDNITRDLLTSGTLQRYIAELSVTGLTSNPTIFDHAIKSGTAYDAAIRERLRAGKSGEKLFFEIALEDITRAADLFRPVHERTDGVDGWVSLEVSPLLAYDTQHDPARGAGSACARGPAQCLHQDSGNRRRAAGDRGSDLRGRSDQCDAAVFPARSIWRRPKPGCAASSAGSRQT